MNSAPMDQQRTPYMQHDGFSSPSRVAVKEPIGGDAAPGNEWVEEWTAMYYPGLLLDAPIKGVAAEAGVDVRSSDRLLPVLTDLQSVPALTEPTIGYPSMGPVNSDMYSSPHSNSDWLFCGGQPLVQQPPLHDSSALDLASQGVDPSCDPFWCTWLDPSNATFDNGQMAPSNMLASEWWPEPSFNGTGPFPGLSLPWQDQSNGPLTAGLAGPSQHDGTFGGTIDAPEGRPTSQLYPTAPLSDEEQLFTWTTDDVYPESVFETHKWRIVHDLSDEEQMACRQGAPGVGPLQVSIDPRGMTVAFRSRLQLHNLLTRAHFSAKTNMCSEVGCANVGRIVERTTTGRVEGLQIRCETHKGIFKILKACEEDHLGLDGRRIALRALGTMHRSKRTGDSGFFCPGCREPSSSHG